MGKKSAKGILISILLCGLSVWLISDNLKEAQRNTESYRNDAIKQIREENDRYNKVDIDSDEVNTVLSNIQNVEKIEADLSNKRPTAKKADTVDESNFTSCYSYWVLSDKQKVLYNEIYTMILNHTETAIISTVNADEIEDIFIAIDADHPELFWVEGYTYVYYTLNDEVVDIELSPVYIINKEQSESIMEAIEKSANSFLQGVNDNMSDYDKAKYIYEMLIMNVDYESDSEYNQNIISALLNRKTVCKGYASAAQYLLRQVGIQSIVVRGTANDEPHAWNKINIDGKWYNYDVTWGNSQYLDGESKAKRIRYDYLNVTDNELSKTHILEMPYETPICDSMDENYFVKENRYVSYWDEEMIGNMFGYAYYSGRPTCDIKFENYDIYQQTVSTFIDNSYIGKYCRGMQEYQYLTDDERCVLTIYF